MAYLTSGNAHDAVLADTVSFQAIPTITIRTSTYKQVFAALTQYDTAYNAQPRKDLAVTTALITLRSALENWMIKPSHKKAFADANSKYSSIKLVFDPLLVEVDTALSQLWQAEDIKFTIGADVSKKLADQLIKNAGFSSSSNPLLVLVLNNLIKTHKINTITKENFQQTLLNFVVSSNDLRGSSSFLIQALGDKAALSFSIDFGKLILPFLKLSLDLGAAKITTTNAIIFFDTLATHFSENDEDHRYGFYRLYGWSREYQGEIGVTAGVEFSTGESSMIELEIAGINAIPSIDPPGVSASATVGAKVSANWSILNSTDLAPTFFTSINSQDIAEQVTKGITDPIPKKITFNNRQGVVLNIYSNAYGGDASANATAEAGAGPVGISISADGKIKADIKKSTIVLQAPSSSSPHAKKTQVTELWLKQLGANADLIGTGKVLGTGVEIGKKEVSYSFHNSFSYSSTTVYWNSEDSSKSIDILTRSGHTRGQSLNIKEIDKRLSNIVDNIKYFSAIAKQLNVRVSLIQDFFENKKEELENIIDTLSHFVSKGELPESVMSSVVLEASFAMKKDKKLTFDLNESTYFPEENSQDMLTDGNNTYLESLRFRVPRWHQSFNEKPGFKLGVNIGIVKFGIDLGMIEQASTFIMDDLIITWFAPGGEPINDRPDNYVPSTALIL